jgi:hypothetical protein
MRVAMMHSSSTCCTIDLHLTWPASCLVKARRALPACAAMTAANLTAACSWTTWATNSSRQQWATNRTRQQWATNRTRQQWATNRTRQQWAAASGPPCQSQASDGRMGRIHHHHALQELVGLRGSEPTAVLVSVPHSPPTRPTHPRLTWYSRYSAGSATANLASTCTR